MLLLDSQALLWLLDDNPRLGPTRFEEWLGRSVQ